MEFEMTTKSDTKEFEPVYIEEGIYSAELKEVKEISEGKYGQRVAFIYEIEGKDLALVCYKTKATENNRLGQTLMAHGVEIVDDKVNTDNLPNKKVNAWVEDFEKEINGKKQKVSTISKVKQMVEKVKKE